MTDHKTNVESRGKELILTRILDASPELVFDSPGSLEKIVEMGAVEGFNSSLKCLDKYLVDIQNA